MIYYKLIAFPITTDSIRLWATKFFRKNSNARKNFKDLLFNRTPLAVSL